jgi:hypothetical protein
MHVHRTRQLDRRIAAGPAARPGLVTTVMPLIRRRVNLRGSTGRVTGRTLVRIP